MIFIFNVVMAKYTVFVGRAVTVVIYRKYTKPELRQCCLETIHTNIR